MPNFEVYKSSFIVDPDQIAEEFQKLGVNANIIRAKDVPLVEITPGAATECIDGRGAKMFRIKHGVKAPGGIHAFADTITGTSRAGYDTANMLLNNVLNQRWGTHTADDEVGCGYHSLREKNLVSVPFTLDQEVRQLEQEEAKKYGKLGKYLEAEAKKRRGWHVRLHGRHEENDAIINLVRGSTVEPRVIIPIGGFFISDIWALIQCGADPEVVIKQHAETLAQLAPHIKTVQIIGKQ